jgi:Domain of unknown function (DUF4276)
MKPLPLYVIVEGQTEQDFFRECLCPYLWNTYGMNEVYVPLLGKVGQKGGNVSASRIHHDATHLLKQRPEAIVSTFVDYYGIRTSIPNYEHCQTLPNAEQRVACLESELAELVKDERFIPYIQKHEFEALLFSRELQDNQYVSSKIIEAIKQTAGTFTDPEEINSNFPPSKRLIDLFAEHERAVYDKRIFGVTLALEIGMPTIVRNCPRFANWVRTIAQLTTT